MAEKRCIRQQKRLLMAYFLKKRILRAARCQIGRRGGRFMASESPFSATRFVPRLAHLGEPLESPVSLSRPWPAHRLGRTRPGPRRPGNFSGTDSRSARHRHPQPLRHSMPQCRRPARRAVSRPVCGHEKNPASSVDRKLLGTSKRASHPARPVPAVAPHGPRCSADACRSAIGRATYFILSFGVTGTARG
jgi:hypothetical protein